MRRTLLGLAALLALLAVLAPPARGALVCETRAAAVALVRAACALDAACRFTVDAPPDALGGWDALLGASGAAIVAADNATALADEVRAIMWPTAPAWRPWPLVAYAVAGAPTHACAALVAPGVLETLAPPPELLLALYVLDVHQALLAEERRCSDVNEAPLYDPLSGNVTCACAPDTTCHAPAVDTTAALIVVMTVAAAAMVAAGALYVVIASAHQLRLQHRALKRERERGDTGGEERLLTISPAKGAFPL